MRSLSVLLTMMTLSVGIAACGSGKDASSAPHTPAAGATTSRVATAASSATSTQDHAKADRDKDNDGSPPNDTSTNDVLDYGHEASATDKLGITALVGRYYAAATAGDGAKACSMLYITLAEAIAEDYGHGSAGPSYLSQGTTCPAVMNLLFKHYHSQLTTELPLLKVTHVRLIQHHGLAILNFGMMPEHEISVRREARTWKIATLLDSELP